MRAEERSVIRREAGSGLHAVGAKRAQRANDAPSSLPRYAMADSGRGPQHLSVTGFPRSVVAAGRTEPTMQWTTLVRWCRQPYGRGQVRWARLRQRAPAIS